MRASWIYYPGWVADAGWQAPKKFPQTENIQVREAVPRHFDFRGLA